MSLIESVLISGIVKSTNGVFVTEKSVLLMEVSSIQGCPYRGVPLYIHVHIRTHSSLSLKMYILILVRLQKIRGSYTSSWGLCVHIRCFHFHPIFSCTCTCRLKIATHAYLALRISIRMR